MRFANANFGEQPNAVARMTTGDTVTVSVIDLANPGSALALTSAVAAESAAEPGLFIWSTGNLVVQPTTFTELVVTFTNQNGRKRDAKIVVGGFPSDSAIHRYEGAVHIDPVGGSPGTTFPIGTPSDPCNNLTDARAIAVALGISKYVLVSGGTLLIDTDHLGWAFEGEGPNDAVYTIDPTADVTGSSFFQCGVLGDFSGGGRVTMQQCLLGQSAGTVIGLQGVFNTVGTFGTLRLAAGGSFEALDLASRDLIGGTTIDFNGAAATFAASGLTGVFSIVNNTNALGIMGAALQGGLLTLAASVTSGIYVLLGQGEFTNNATSVASLSDFVLRGSDLIRVQNATAARALIDISTTPWTEVRYVFDRANPGDSVVHEIYELYDQDGVALAGNALAGNNPIADPTRLIAERRRI